MLALPLALSTDIYIYIYKCISIYTPTSACLSDLHFPFRKSPSELGHLELTGSTQTKDQKGTSPLLNQWKQGLNEKATSRDTMETQQKKKAKASLRESLETGVASSREANLKNGPTIFFF